MWLIHSHDNSPRKNSKDVSAKPFSCLPLIISFPAKARTEQDIQNEVRSYGIWMQFFHSTARCVHRLRLSHDEEVTIGSAAFLKPLILKAFVRNRLDELLNNISIYFIAHEEVNTPTIWNLALL